ncbi:MAG: hypothetical protein U1F70_01915 [Candidatus Competibacteraceae bacterium]
MPGNGTLTPGNCSHAQRDRLLAKAKWLDEAIIEIIISEAQNEVADFKKVGFRHHPPPADDEAGLRDGGWSAGGCGIRLQRSGAPVSYRHRLRHVADRLRRGMPLDALSRQADEGAHPDAKAIARANRRYRSKDFGLIVDYNGMLKSLREALAQYALGDKGDPSDDVVAPVEEERAKALLDAIEATEAHLPGIWGSTRPN